jgi:Flp pilus assembly protein TadD
MSRPPQDVYRPCPCGSGRKYKFCCREKGHDRRREILERVPHTIGPDGKPIVFLDLEEGERLHELGLDLVQNGRGREAIPVLERAVEVAPLVPHPYNNLALAHFLAGDPLKAVEVSEDVDRVIDPGNTFALGNLVHFYLVVGRDRDAEEVGDRLRGRPPESEDAAVRMCEAFARLGRHEDVLQATRPHRWRGLHRARIAFLQGTAAANLGRYALARQLLGDAHDDPVHCKRARGYLGLLERGRGPETLDGDWPYFECVEWTSLDDLDRLRTDGRLRSHPGLVQALVMVLNDDPEAREMCLHVLREIGSPRAVEVLRRVATGTFGTEGLRLTALGILRDLGNVSAKEAVPLWRSGAWTEVRCVRFEITDEAVSAAPSWVRGAIEEIGKAMRSGDHARAEKKGRELAARAPDVPMVLHNLAAALEAQGKREEAEGLLRRAMELDPRYVFAPAGLAMIRLEQRRVEEARQILASVVLPERLHPQAWACWLSAQMQVALAEGNLDGATSSYELLRQLPGEDEVREMPDFAGRLLLGLKSLLDARRKRHDKQRRRLLAPDAGVRACLEGYTGEQLAGIAAALGLAGKGPHGKRPLLEHIAARLGGSRNVLSLAGSLPTAASEALRDVLGHGGILAYADFTRRYGSGESDEDWWRTPGTPLGRLKLLGLLAEGTVGGRESVLVPAEVRAALSVAGASPRRSQEQGGQDRASTG